MYLRPNPPPGWPLRPRDCNEKSRLLDEGREEEDEMEEENMEGRSIEWLALLLVVWIALGAAYCL